METSSRLSDRGESRFRVFPRWPAFVVRLGAEHLRGKYSHRLPLWRRCIPNDFATEHQPKSEWKCSAFNAKSAMSSRDANDNNRVFVFLLFLSFVVLGETRLSRRCRRHEILRCCSILCRREYILISSREICWLSERFFTKIWINFFNSLMIDKMIFEKMILFLRCLGMRKEDWKRNCSEISFLPLYTYSQSEKRKLVYFIFPFNSEFFCGDWTFPNDL